MLTTTVTGRPVFGVGGRGVGAGCGDTPAVNTFDVKLLELNLQHGPDRDKFSVQTEEGGEDY